MGNVTRNRPTQNRPTQNSTARNSMTRNSMTRNSMTRNSMTRNQHKTNQNNSSGGGRSRIVGPIQQIHGTQRKTLEKILPCNTTTLFDIIENQLTKTVDGTFSYEHVCQVIYQQVRYARSLNQDFYMQWLRDRAIWHEYWHNMAVNQLLQEHDNNIMALSFEMVESRTIDVWLSTFLQEHRVRLLLVSHVMLGRVLHDRRLAGVGPVVLGAWWEAFTVLLDKHFGEQGDSGDLVRVWGVVQGLCDGCEGDGLVTSSGFRVGSVRELAGLDERQTRKSCDDGSGGLDIESVAMCYSPFATVNN